MTLRGRIDGIDRSQLRGWVQDEADPETPVSLTVQVDGAPLLRVLANTYREDLEQAGIGSGRHGFSVKLAALSPLAAHVLHVRREHDGFDMPGSPLDIPAVLTFDAKCMDDVARALADGADEAELLVRAGFLAQQVDRLLQACADRRASPAQQHFRARWAGRSAPLPPEAKPRILVIDDRYPTPTQDAGSQAIVSHMLSLQRLGFAVVFAAADLSGAVDAAGLEAMGISCRCRPWAASLEEVLQREANGFAAVYIHRIGNTRYLSLVRHYQPRARLIYSVADLHHLRLARQAAVEDRPELREASHRLRAAELAAIRHVDSVITHSSFEAGLIRQEVPDAAVHVVPWALKPHPTKIRFDQRRGMAFIGNYAHAPNLDAALWLVQEVMPAVRHLDPSIECLLFGSAMPDVLRQIVAPGVRALGYAADLAVVFDQVRLTVAPLTYGAGVKGKVYESMAAGIPCACTPVAAEGMDLPDSLQALVAEDPAQLAAILVRLHEDSDFNAACSEAGLAYARRELSEHRLDALMRAAVFGPKAAAVAVRTD